ncbi:hypothetical protein ACFVH6_11325 [Spirillospora sp. NPDC127200]
MACVDTPGNTVIGTGDVLADLETQFQQLVIRPKPLALDGGEIGHGLPLQQIKLGELRTMLLAPTTGRTLKDAVWRLLVQRARSEGGDWVSGCVGMALPGLRAAAARAVRCSPDRLADDIVAELLAEFLAQLSRIDLARDDIAARLVWWGRKGALRERGRAMRHLPIDPHEAVRMAERAASDPACEPSDAPPPQAEPADLLAEAVQQQIITSDEAALIRATRLEALSLRTYAAARDEGASKLYSRRQRAEARLTAAIADGRVSASSLVM